MPDRDDEHLQVQVPAVTKLDIEMKAVQARVSIRMFVLEALAAYGVDVPKDAIRDRRGRRG